MAALLDYARNVHSQLGEDGIVERVVDVIGETSRWCCEFGAWDGVYLSNTRALIERGRRGVLIEADPERFDRLREKYPPGSGHITINAYVDDGESSLDALSETHGVEEELDFLSIDIDGLDYEIFTSLAVRPGLICVEVNGACDPESRTQLPHEVAARGVGQPLTLFVEAADVLGYRLIAYTGNAFFQRDDVGHEEELPTLEPLDAWEDLGSNLSPELRFWLYKMNLAFESPHYRFENPRLTAEHLRIPAQLVLKARLSWHARLPARLLLKARSWGRSG